VIGLESIYEQHFHPGETATRLALVKQLWLPFAEAPMAAILGLVAAGLGFAGAYRMYARATKDPLPEKLGSLSRAMRNRFYFDEFYEGTFIRLHDFLAAIAEWFDKWIIAGAVVRGTHGTTELLGRALRLVQTGNLQTYAFLFALGVALVLYLALK